MPLGKYYCDYCEKQFQDTPFARKRHLQSLSHQKAKALWFDSFRDSNQPFSDAFGTRVCNRFLTTGFCQYGDSCKYFHSKNNLQYSSSQPIAGFPENNQAPNVPVNQFMEGSSLTGSLDRLRTSWGNLPPSLMPPPEGGYPPLPFVDWG
ncbi:zinc finger CCCH domain-containing protein 3 isoform X1 [Cucurbita maxima]|uniref:Zinc finger CCCH domain-containing protein 3 isoform X1 n=1 Tax=Cucurbita maxima TaxID=3661 RepID=A0A6J1JFY8_CUCMA|nr:zinc finger CCCH domain-containing protein 3 isoform X1 [Cucurbita maxima]XP_022989488.1 zinc finger CCCH domain-containing protein 3 isoform X1 [Cucurbita maxima]